MAKGTAIVTRQATGPGEVNRSSPPNQEAARPAHRGVLRRFAAAVRREGPATAVALVWQYATDAIAGYRFDRRYGVETREVVPLRSLGISSPNLGEGVTYRPIAPATLDEMLGHVAGPREGRTFVDMGSGKGRALLLAAEHGYSRVIGVEFSRVLHEQAAENIARYRERRGSTAAIESRNQDAAEFEFPDEPLVVLFYNPFGRPVLSQVLDRLERSLREHPRAATILYRAPEWSSLLDGSSRFRLHASTRAYRVYESGDPADERRDR